MIQRKYNNIKLQKTRKPSGFLVFFLILIKTFKNHLTSLVYSCRMNIDYICRTKKEAVIMSNEAITISDTELEIMKALWHGHAPMNTQAISSAVAHKAWKRTTIATLLTRLVEKGAVRAEKQGKLYCYMPLITEKAYKKSQTKNLIQTLYNGSVRDLAVSLFEDNTLSDEDIADLRKRFGL